MLWLLALFLFAVSGVKPQLKGSTLEVNVNTTQGNWAACSWENQWCPAGWDYTIFGYGLGSRFFFEVSSGYTGVPCNNDFFGDPARGDNKKCVFKKLDTTDKGLSWPTAWYGLANEGARTNSLGCTRWIRYGHGTNFYYKLMTGEFWCNNDWFGDPKGGASKYCQYGNTCVNFGTRDLCAIEGQDCNMYDASTNAFHIMQFEYGGRGIIKLSSGPTVRCENWAAAVDVWSGAQKRCYYYKNPPTGQFGTPVGLWKHVGSGYGISLQLTEGWTRTQGTEKSSSWGSSLAVAIEAGYEFGGASVKSTVTATIWSSEAYSYKDEIQKQASKTCSAPCPSNSSYNLWQWLLDVPEACSLNDFSCVTNLGTCHFRCRTMNGPPACPWFKCCDNDCTRCSDYNGNC